METEKAKINLEAYKVRLFDEKNSLVVKREELQAKIVALNAAGSSNVLVRRHQDCNDHCLCSESQGVRRQVRWGGAALVQCRIYQGKQWTGFNALGLQ